MPIGQSRRRFLGQLGIAGVAGMGGLASAGIGGSVRSFAAEPPPEVTTIRFAKDPVTCIAPQAAEGCCEPRVLPISATWMSLRRAYNGPRPPSRAVLPI